MDKKFILTFVPLVYGFLCSYLKTPAITQLNVVYFNVTVVILW